MLADVTLGMVGLLHGITRTTHGMILSIILGMVRCTILGTMVSIARTTIATAIMDGPLPIIMAATTMVAVVPAAIIPITVMEAQADPSAAMATPMVTSPAIVALPAHPRPLPAVPVLLQHVPALSPAILPSIAVVIPALPAAIAEVTSVVPVLHLYRLHRPLAEAEASAVVAVAPYAAPAAVAAVAAESARVVADKCFTC